MARVADFNQVLAYNFWMDIDHARILANELMYLYSLDGWQLAFNNSKRMLGVCKEGEKKIELSRVYVLQNTEKHVQDTILHEIAHALVGVKHGHNQVWRDMCKRVGATPAACDKSASLPEGAWQARCPGCLTLFSRHRRPVRLSGMYCRKCGAERGKLLFRNVRKGAPTPEPFIKPVLAIKQERVQAPRQLTLF